MDRKPSPSRMWRIERWEPAGIRSVDATAGMVWLEGPTEAGRGRHGDDVERMGIGRDADGAEIRGLAEDLAEDVEIDNRLARLEGEGLFGAVRAVLVVAEELHREGSRRGADVGDREVRRVERAVDAARMDARGKEPAVRCGSGDGGRLGEDDRGIVRPLVDDGGEAREEGARRRGGEDDTCAGYGPEIPMSLTTRLTWIMPFGGTV